MALDRQIALARATAGIGAIEHIVMLDLEVRRAFQRHRTANMHIRHIDFSLGETEEGQQFEGRIVELFSRHFQCAGEEVSAEAPFVEDKFDVESAREGFFDRLKLVVAEALGTQARMIDARRLAHGGMAHRKGFDLGNLRLAITQCAKRLGNSAVDDFEITTACELLEFHQSEIGLNAGRVAIHDKADRAGRRDNGDLRIAIAVLLAQRKREIPGLFGMIDKDLAVDRHGPERRMIQRHRRDRESLVAFRQTMGRAAMIADHAQHVVFVRAMAGEGAVLLRHFGGSRIANTRHDRRKRAADCATFIGIIADARGHEQAADIGVAEAQRAVLIREFGNFLRRELRHQHRDFEHDGPQANRMFIGHNVESAGLGIAELQQIERCQIAGRVVEEHIFRARIGRIDATRRRACVPVVDGRIILQAGIGRSPGGIADLFPEILGLQRLVGLAVNAPCEVPIGIGLDRAQEVVGDANRIVRILAGDRQIGFRIPVSVISVELNVGIALTRKLHHALDIAVRHGIAARHFDGFFQRRILFRIVAIVIVADAIHAGLQNRLHMALDDFRAGDERGNLLLFLHLPIDIGLDIRMVGIDHHHLGRATRCAA